MKIHMFTPKYLVRFQNKRLIRWDGESTLTLGFPVRYALEMRNEKIWVRDFTISSGIVQAVKIISIDQLEANQTLALSDSRPKDSVSFQAIRKLPVVNWATLSKISLVTISEAVVIPVEDLLFRKHLQKVAGVMAMLFLAIFIEKWREPDVKTNEDLIPAKFAKLILTKPKETKVPSSGGATGSQAQVKAIARAFQSKTVQKSMKNILRGGLSHYSVLATGRAIQSLSQKISGQSNDVGAGLQNKASTLLAGSQVGNFKMGNDAGYGTGKGVNVQGQGKGQFDIGLNTAEATVDEGLTKDEVAKVIHSHMNEIRYCYESGILKDPNLAGKLLVDFKINEKGIVPNAGVGEASLHDQAVTQCLLGKLKSWKFPAPRGGVNVAVSYPFIFKSLSR